MIENYNVNLIQKAARMSLYDVSPDVDEIRFGQHFQLNDDGEWEYADGTKKSYPTINERYRGAGIGIQGERLEGRDEVTAIGKITVLVSNFEISTMAYDTEGTYEVGMPLISGTNGILKPFDDTSDNAAFIAGYVTGVPSDIDAPIKYQG